MSQKELNAIFDDMMANSEVGKLFHVSDFANLKWLCIEFNRRIEQEKERRATLLEKIALMESEHGSKNKIVPEKGGDSDASNCCVQTDRN